LGGQGKRCIMSESDVGELQARLIFPGMALTRKRSGYEHTNCPLIAIRLRPMLDRPVARTISLVGLPGRRFTPAARRSREWRQPMTGTEVGL